MKKERPIFNETKNPQVYVAEMQEYLQEQELPDHFEIEAGSAAKGIKVSLKTYYNAMEIDEAQKKIENTLKIRQYLLDKGIIQ